MAQWKKVIISGSSAELESLNVDNVVRVGTTQIISGSEDTKLSGSFSGSFTGDGSGIIGLPVELRVSGSSTNGEVGLLEGSLSILGGTAVTTTVSGVGVDPIVTINVQDGSTSQKGISSFNSDGFTVTSGNVSLANSATGAVLSIAGTANQTTVSRTNGTVTIGLPTNVTIQGTIAGNVLDITTNAGVGGNLTVTGTSTFNDDVTVSGLNNLIVGGNASIGGDLIVSGDVTAINTTNLEISDRFILLNSGSNQSATQKGGIVIDESNGIGAGFIYNSSDDRWGFNEATDANNQVGITSEAYVATVTTGASGQFGGKYDKVGNIRVDAQGDIFIWT